MLAVGTVVELMGVYGYRLNLLTCSCLGLRVLTECLISSLVRGFVSAFYFTNFIGHFDYPF